MASLLKDFLSIQERFSNDKVHVFVEKYWHWCIYISFVYVVTIFALKAWMENREKYDLRKPLVIWSSLLALFSIYGFWMNGVDHIKYLWQNGWEKSICERTMIDGAKGLWSFLFCFSKAPELVDTYFIVMRKQKLIFLHWYHHITVFVYCWFHYSQQIHAAQWFIIMNYFVHAVMYSYYAVRASGWYRPPVWVNMLITLLQLTQMFVGVGINVFVYYQMTTDPNWKCDGIIETTYLYVYWSFLMYFSYLLLFAHFFYGAYLSRKSRSKGTNQPADAIRSGVNGLQNGHLQHTEGVTNVDGHLSNGPSINGPELRRRMLRQH